jgi:hypothetical protein
MGMNRDKFRNIVGGITTSEPKAPPAPPLPAEEPAIPATVKAQQAEAPTPAGKGPADEHKADHADDADTGEGRRFAKRGRPKGRKPDAATGTTRKVKVSLFLNEVIVNDLYEWAHADRMHPGEMFEAALKPFHEKEAKRRKGGKE